MNAHAKPASTGPDAPLQGPLKGLRVIDAGRMVAGPLAATQLADFGAEVIKFELPGAGDSMRHWAPMKEGRSLWWKVIARNKRLVTLTLSKPRGQELFRELVKTADIVIENYRPGTFERWGLGYKDLAEINPRLVMVRVSGFGQSGPYARRGGYGTIAEAFSGIPSFTGFPTGRPPCRASPWPIPSLPPSPPCRQCSRSTIATTMAAAAEIDVSLYEPLFRLVESQVIGFDQLGIVKRRQGNRLAEDSPRNTYETRDGRWIGISASSQRTFERLAAAIGMPNLIDDPRFVDNSSRCTNDVALDEVIAGWFKQRTCDEVMKLFDEADVVAGPVLDIGDIVKDPQYIARENIVSVSDVDFGSVRMQGVVPKFSETPGKVRHAGGRIGADNHAIFVGELDLSEAEFSSLQAEGVI
jgi:crotonobetainyl-CoA:carnitine CoA-transferase CaiB-like acyl-CoA transferase